MWTTEMNKSVIQLYFKTTKLETEFNNYKAEMLLLFNEQFPRFADRMTGAKLMERKRYLFNYNKISTTEINELKSLVERELRINDDSNVSENQIITSVRRESLLNLSIIEIVEEQNGTLDNITDQELYSDLARELNAALTSFIGTNPLLRKRIPKLRYSFKLEKIILIFNDHILPRILSECNDIEHFHTLVYCVAYATCITLGLRMSTNSENLNRNRKQPWMRRLENRINETRTKLGRLTQYNLGNRSIKLINNINKSIHPQRIEELHTEQLTELVHSTTQRLRILANRLKRYTEMQTRKSENNMFEQNQKKFYQKLKFKHCQNQQREIPNMENLTNYWSNLWENPAMFNNDATWLKEEISRSDNIIEMDDISITTEDIKEACKKSNNWKSPGKDGIHNFWYKKLSSLHSKMALLFNDFLNNPSKMPNFMTNGITFLIQKDMSVSDVSNYRPITCLPTLYKIFSSIITMKTEQHCTNNNIIPPEQKGCGIGSKGCKDQICIDSVVVGQATHYNRNLSMAYIDYKKAYDSMSHTYLLEILKIYKISKNIINFLACSINNWSTTLYVNHESKNIQSRNIQIKRGIFQGDIFSPLWFCLGINPLSRTIMSTNYGFELKSENGCKKVSHLLYMDDLKLFANSSEQLHKMLAISEKFSRDVNMFFNTDKTKIINLYRGKLLTTTGYITNNDTIINDICKQEFYKYLGFAQLRGILHTEIKVKMRKIFKKRTNDILKTYLNSKNKIRAINQYVIPYLTYSFGIIKWSGTDLDGIERDLRKCMRYNRMHDPKAAVERICLPRDKGGRGIIDIKKLFVTQIENLRHYFLHNEEYNIICAADESYTALHLKTVTYEPDVRFETIEEKISAWKQKTIHGIYPNHLQASHINEQFSNLWLIKGELFSETEGFMMSIQDRVVLTRNYRKYILHQNITNEKCRLCNQVSENIDHIINGCTTLAATEYLDRHNNVGKIIHQNIAFECNFIQEKLPYYKYKPVNIYENENYLLCWDRQIETDKTIFANKPDIICWNKKEKRLKIIDIAVPLNSTIQKSYGEKVRKYKDLQEELKTLWKVKECCIIPIIISSTGLVPHSLVESLKEINMENEIENIQKAVILSTCHVVRKFLA